MRTTQEIIIDVLKPRQNVMHVVQEDSTRHIRLVLLANNLPFDPVSDLESRDDLLAFVEFRKPDGHGGIYDTTSLGETAVELEDSEGNNPNIYIVALDGQCFTCPGWTQINIRFETEDGKRIHTFRIMVDVEPSASSDTESTDWNYLESIAGLRQAVAGLWETRVSMEAKYALLNLLAHVAYTDKHGQDYLDELETELFRTVGIVSISAVFNPGTEVIYDIDDLETLRQYLTVTALYEDASSREVTLYTLAGVLAVGTDTISVSYAGKATTFDVTVTAYPPLWETTDQAFNGGYVSTLTPLCNEDRDWTIAFDVALDTNPTSGDASKYRLPRVLNNGGTAYAVAFFKATAAAANYTWQYMGTQKTITGATVGTGRIRFVITHEKDSGEASIAFRKDSGEPVTDSISATFAAATANVVIGQSSGENQLPKGTLNNASLWDIVWDTERINDFLGV